METALNGIDLCCTSRRDLERLLTLAIRAGFDADSAAIQDELDRRPR